MFAGTGKKKGHLVGCEAMWDSIDFDVRLTFVNRDELHVALGARTVNAAGRIDHLPEIGVEMTDVHYGYVFDH